MNKKYATLLLASAVAVASTPALAATTADLQISASVVGACEIEKTADLTFANYDALDPQDVDAQGTLRVRCTNGVTGTITLDEGAHADGAARRMAHATDTNSFLTYELYSDAAGGTVWNDVDGVTHAGTGAWAPLTVYGRIPSAQPASPAAGAYADTVVATVSF